MNYYYPVGNAAPVLGDSPYARHSAVYAGMPTSLGPGGPYPAGLAQPQPPGGVPPSMGSAGIQRPPVIPGLPSALPSSPNYPPSSIYSPAGLGPGSMPGGSPYASVSVSSGLYPVTTMAHPPAGPSTYPQQQPTVSPVRPTVISPSPYMATQHASRYAGTPLAPPPSSVVSFPVSSTYPLASPMYVYSSAPTMTAPAYPSQVPRMATAPGYPPMSIQAPVASYPPHMAVSQGMMSMPRAPSMLPAMSSPGFMARPI